MQFLKVIIKYRPKLKLFIIIIQSALGLLNCHFCPNIGIFGPFDPMPDQKTMRTRCLGGFPIMWVTKLLTFLVKIRIFCPKTTKFGRKLAFLVIFGQALPAHLVPCWWVGWWLWRTGCISQDTYLLYEYSTFAFVTLRKTLVKGLPLDWFRLFVNFSFIF